MKESSKRDKKILVDWRRKEKEENRLLTALEARARGRGADVLGLAVGVSAHVRLGNVMIANTGIRLVATAALLVGRILVLELGAGEALRGGCFGGIPLGRGALEEKRRKLKKGQSIRRGENGWRGGGGRVRDEA